jgi:hypothetical protein
MKSLALTGKRKSNREREKRQSGFIADAGLVSGKSL